MNSGRALVKYEYHRKDKAERESKTSRRRDYKDERCVVAKSIRQVVPVVHRRFTTEV